MNVMAFSCPMKRHGLFKDLRASGEYPPQREVLLGAMDVMLQVPVKFVVAHDPPGC